MTRQLPLEKTAGKRSSRVRRVFERRAGLPKIEFADHPQIIFDLLFRERNLFVKRLMTTDGGGFSVRVQIEFECVAAE